MPPSAVKRAWGGARGRVLPVGPSRRQGRGGDGDRAGAGGADGNVSRPESGQSSSAAIHWGPTWSIVQGPMRIRCSSAWLVVRGVVVAALVLLLSVPHRILMGP